MALSPRKLKLVVIIVASVFVLGLILVLMIPSILSGPGKGFIVGKINDSVDGNVTIESLSLSWGGPQRIKGMTLTDPGGGEVLSIESIDAPDITLLGAAGGDMNFGAITITGLKLNIEQGADGSSNLNRATASPDKGRDVPQDDSSSGVPAGLSCLIQLNSAHVSFKAPDSAPVVADIAQATVDLTDLASVKTSLQGNVQQGGAGGDVNANATLANLFDSAGRVDMAGLKVDAAVDVSDVPTALLDRLADQGGAIEALLGDTVTARLKAQTQGETRQVNVSIDSPNLKTGQADLTMTADKLTLNNQLDLTLNMTPPAWSAWTTDAKTTLRKPFVIKAVVSKLSMPYVNGKPAIGQASVEAAIDSQDIELQSSDPRIGAVALRSAKLALQAPSLGDALALKIDAIAEQGSQSGGLKLDANLANAIDSAGKFNADAITGVVMCEIVKAPLAVIDQILQTDGLLTAALGDSLNAQVNANLKAAGDGEVQLVADADHVKARVNARISKTALVADSGSQINLLIKPDLFARFVEGKSITQAINASLAINKLTLPRKGESWSTADAAIDATLSMSDVVMPDAQGGEPMIIGKPSIAIQSARLADKINLSGSTGVNQLAGDIIGRNVNFQVVFQPDKPFKPDAPTGMFAIKADAPNLKSALAGNYDGKIVQLATDSRVSMTVTPKILASLMPKSDDPAAAPMGLAHDAAVTVTFHRASLPLDDMASGSVDLIASIDKLALTGDPKLQQVLLHTIRAGVQSQALGQSVQVVADSKLQHGQLVGDLHAEAKLGDPLKSASLQQAAVKLDPLPVALVDMFAAQNGKLVSLLGETMSVTFDATPQGAGRLAFKADAESPRFKLKGSGTYVADQAVSLNKGTSIALMLSPQSFAALQQDKVTWHLLEPTTISATFDRANFGLPAGDLRAMQLAANVNSTGLKLQQVETQQTYQMKNIAASVDAINPAKTMRLDINADLVGADGAGQVRSNTTVSNGLDDKGAFSLARAVIRTQTQTDPLPSTLVVALLQLNADYAEIMGPTTTLSLIGDYPGDLDLDLVGANTQTSARVTFDPSRTLTLREPAVATMKITPALTRVLLGEIHPVLADVHQSKNPIRLTVSQLNVPLGLYDNGGANALVGASSADLQLELGELTLKESWLLQGVVGQLIKIGARIPPRDSVDTLFTPLQASLRNGVITTNDMWLQSPNTVVGVQGTIQPLADKFDFTIGVGGETFQRLGGDIVKVIRPETIIELQNVTSKGGYAKKIGAIFLEIAKASAANIGGTVGGEKGALIGAIVGAVAQKVFEPKRPTLSWAGRPPIEQSLQRMGLIRNPNQVPVQPAPEQPAPQPAPMQPEKSEKQQRRENVENALKNIFGN